jgi:regulator of sirC expression with transglutaminase-like and TPR domain
MDLDAILARLAAEPDAPLDVAEVALQIARDEDPALDVEGYLSELAAMAREARDLVRGDLAGRLAGLCRYLFHDMGFRGNVRHYDDPLNSYLNHVLDRRTGIPISLSVLAMAVGARAGLTIMGVGLPGHFVAKAVDGDVEFFFDPFHGGRLLTPSDCETLVQQVTGIPFEATPVMLQSASLAAIVERILRNLKSTYVRRGDYRRAARVIDRIVRLRPRDPGERRDLGISLLHNGQPGRGIGFLEAYLAAAPDADDAAAIQQVLKHARTELARWN